MPFFVFAGDNEPAMEVAGSAHTDAARPPLALLLRAAATLSRKNATREATEGWRPRKHVQALPPDRRCLAAMSGIRRSECWCLATDGTGLEWDLGLTGKHDQMWKKEVSS